MSVTWPYAQLAKAAKAAGGPNSFCRGLVDLGYQKGYAAMGKKCIPFVVTAGTVLYLVGRFRATRQQDQTLLRSQQEQMFGLIQETIQARIREAENGIDETCREFESVSDASSNVQQNRIVQYGPVDYQRQLQIVSNHWYAANMNLGEREYDLADFAHRHVLEDVAAAKIRIGMEIAVGCILRLHDVPDVDYMDLCQKISSCDRYIESDLIERMHRSRKLCNRCLHSSDRPANTKERLTYAARTLGTLKSYLETYLNQPRNDGEEI